MDALQNLLSRRSIRKYKPDMLPREIIEKIAEAGTYAATGKNQQSTIIVAVTNQALRDRMSQLNAAGDAYHRVTAGTVLPEEIPNPGHTGFLHFHRIEHKKRLLFLLS